MSAREVECARQRAMPYIQMKGFAGAQVKGQFIARLRPEFWQSLDPPPADYEIFLRNFPDEMLEDQLFPLVESLGGLFEFRLMLRFSGNSRRMAFATYVSEEAYQNALRELNNIPVGNSTLEATPSYNKRYISIRDIPSSKYSLREIGKLVFTSTFDAVEILAARDASKITIAIRYKSHMSAAAARKILIAEIKNLNESFVPEWVNPLHKNYLQGFNYTLRMTEEGKLDITETVSVQDVVITRPKSSARPIKGQKYPDPQPKSKNKKKQQPLFLRLPAEQPGCSGVAKSPRLQSPKDIEDFIRGEERRKYDEYMARLTPSSRKNPEMFTFDAAAVEAYRNAGQYVSGPPPAEQQLEPVRSPLNPLAKPYYSFRENGFDESASNWTGFSDEDESMHSSPIFRNNRSDSSSTCSSQKDQHSKREGAMIVLGRNQMNQVSSTFPREQPDLNLINENLVNHVTPRFSPQINPNIVTATFIPSLREQLLQDGDRAWSGKKSYNSVCPESLHGEPYPCEDEIWSSNGASGLNNMFNPWYAQPLGGEPSRREDWNIASTSAIGRQRYYPKEVPENQQGAHGYNVRLHPIGPKKSANFIPVGFLPLPRFEGSERNQPPQGRTSDNAEREVIRGPVFSGKDLFNFPPQDEADYDAQMDINNIFKNN